MDMWGPYLQMPHLLPLLLIRTPSTNLNHFKFRQLPSSPRHCKFGFQPNRISNRAPVPPSMSTPTSLKYHNHLALRHSALSVHYYRRINLHLKLRRLLRMHLCQLHHLDLVVSDLTLLSRRGNLLMSVLCKPLGLLPGSHDLTQTIEMACTT